MKDNSMNEVAAKLAEMKNAVVEAQNSAAKAVADEALARLSLTLKNANKSTKDVESPMSSTAYMDALLSGACWRALRAELPAALMRVNGVAIERQEMATRDPISEMESVSIGKRTQWFNTLDERLELIETELERYYSLYTSALKASARDDEARQSDIASADVVYTYVPNLRWITLAERDTEDSASANDYAQLYSRALSFIARQM